MTDKTGPWSYGFTGVQYEQLDYGLVSETLPPQGFLQTYFFGQLVAQGVRFCLFAILKWPDLKTRLKKQNGGLEKWCRHILES